MISCQDFYNILRDKGVDLFTGVPDSLLKDFCAYIFDKVQDDKYIITANEGNAVALACGHYLASGKIPLVFMQNSGIGNCVNPLVSLVDKEVYSIPVLLMIGWRGEPGKDDEPQHIKQGKITLRLMETLGIPYAILPDKVKAAKLCLNKIYAAMIKNKTCAALIVRSKTFMPYVAKRKSPSEKLSRLSREEAIKIIINQLGPKDIVVSTTGYTSRELFELRESLRQGHKKDFLTVGSMGYSSSIALGVALKKKNRSVYCLDGDGAALMHMGSLSTIGSLSPENFKHIILNNGAHDSVGGQPTAGFKVDFRKIAKACGYKNIFSASNRQQLKNSLSKIKNNTGPAFLEIIVRKGARSDLGRPTIPPGKNKRDFMSFLK